MAAKEDELFQEVPEDGCTLLVSKRIKTPETSQAELTRRFFEQMRRGESGVIYNSDKGKLEEVK